MSTDVQLLPPRDAETGHETATLRCVCSPVRGADGQLRMVCAEMRVGETVAEVLPRMHTWSRVILNGRMLSENEQRETVLYAGDEITAFPQWGDPVLTPTLISIAVGLAVSLAAAGINYLLFPPEKPHAIKQEVEEPTESFEGIRTTVGPGAVVPVVYGRRRVGGQLLSAQVVQALTIVDAPVPGSVPQIAITDVTGGTLAPGGAPFDEIVVTAPNHGATNGMHVDIGGVLGKTRTNGGWFVKILDVHRVQLMGSKGIDPTPYQGGGVLVVVDEAATGIRRVDAITTPPTLTMLLALSEGPIGGVLAETIEINGQPIGNFPGVQWDQRLGTPDQTAMPDFGEVAFTFADGRDVPPLPAITYTTTAPVDAFVLNIVFNSGLYFLSPTGEKQENVSTIGYRYRINPGGLYTAYSYFDVAAARTAPVRFGIRRQGLPKAVYDIEVAWSHAFHVDDVRAKWTPTLESVTEIQANTNTYPNTALFGLKAVAMDSLQGPRPEVTMDILGKAVRVNEFLPNLNWTENPAWAVMDLMTNTRYGMKIPDSNIDLPAFSAWGAYCDEIVDGEKRHTFNYVLDREQRAQPLVLDIGGSSRTIMIKQGNVWSPRPTQNTAPVQLLSWANCSNVKLTYTKDPDDINVMEARFSNEDIQYAQDVLTWPTIANWPATVHKGSMTLTGVTKPSRVMRALQFDLNRRRFELLSLACDCALDAIVLQPHDIFRFSHPMPGWGTSGRVQAGSTVGTVYLDTPVTFEPGKSYHLYLRFDFDQMDVKPVVNTGGTRSVLHMAVPFAQQPDADVTLWAFGESSPIDTAVKLFRVVQVQRRSNNTVHLQAIAHNPSIYTEAVATPLPPITTLPNPAGVPPPLVSLVATEVVRIQASGASLRAVDLSWDVATLSAGYAPYGGAAIFRRSVVLSGMLGQVQAGVVELGTITNPNDPNVNFAPIATVRGHVLDYDDYTIVSGSTYIYRVVPLSGQGVPNNVGAREVVVHIAGPTTSGFFPGTPQRLRLRGQAVGQTAFEGRDVHIEWDSVADSPLFSTTFFVVTYTIEVWAPGQEYLMRRTIVPAGAPNQTLQWTYTFEQNQEDNLRAGMAGARRELLFLVYANANTGVSSITPAQLLVNNLPPDMGDILPTATPMFQAGLINWQQWVEPRDFSHYIIYVDVVTPPIAIYQGVGQIFQEIALFDLPANVPQYTYLLPFDTFGAGIPSQIATFTPVALDAGSIDTTPPDDPTGLVLTTGSDLSDDGTVATWVQAMWDLAPETDVAGYEVHVYLEDSTVPTVYSPKKQQNTIKFFVPGNMLVRVKLLTFDKVHNFSDFLPEATITTAADTTLPAAPTNLLATGALQRIHLLWTPPPDADYAYSEVWMATTNNRALASNVGPDGNIRKGTYSYTEDNLAPNTTRFFWVRAVDRSGNVSTAFHPAGATSGIGATAGQIDSTYISSLVADKITAGVITALVRLGVNQITLDGTVPGIHIFDQNNVLRVQMGRLGPLATDWGLRLFGPGPTNAMMWNFVTGATEDGISDAAVTARKIRAGVVEAGHLRADTAVITSWIQIATAVIRSAHIEAAAIQSTHIGDAQIIATKIQDANILRGHIQDLAVNSAKVDELTASKISTGVLAATYTLGGAARITMDGPNSLITVFDGTGLRRVYLGDVGGGGTNYGLQIWNAANQLMWSFTDGAQTPGIAQSAVTTPKISANAVTASILYFPGGSASSSGTETLVASVTFGQVVTDDVVLLMFTATSTIAASPANMVSTVRIYQDVVSGTPLNSMSDGTPSSANPFAINAYHLVTGGTFNNKQYFVTLQSTGTAGTVSMSDMALIAIRFKR